MTNLQVIGAGMGKTGTTSLRAALEDLGFSPCFHTDETYAKEEKTFLWKSIAKLNFVKDGEKTQNKHLKAIFNEYKATVDFPGYMYYQRFMEWNPSAKVILTIRDSPEQYQQSVQNTFFWPNKEKSWLKRNFWQLVENYLLTPYHLYWMIECIKYLHGKDPMHPDTDLKQFYTEWVESVIDYVPSEKLLVFNVKEGWEPLCKFLGVEVPDHPFPRMNIGAEHRQSVANRQFRNCVRRICKGCALVLMCSAAVFYKDFLWNLTKENLF